LLVQIPQPSHASTDEDSLCPSAVWVGMQYSGQYFVGWGVRNRTLGNTYWAYMNSQWGYTIIVEFSIPYWDCVFGSGIKTYDDAKVLLMIDPWGNIVGP
jgi:hypothetical protein